MRQDASSRTESVRRVRSRYAWAHRPSSSGTGFHPDCPPGGRLRRIKPDVACAPGQPRGASQSPPPSPVASPSTRCDTTALVS
ncbi:MAG TPA: hypothetical protein PKD12_13675 [Nitrospira sp.]|nr:hypothetical protein [Nitrospira sp.]